MGWNEIGVDGSDDAVYWDGDERECVCLRLNELELGDEAIRDAEEALDDIEEILDEMVEGSDVSMRMPGGQVVEDMTATATATGEGREPSTTFATSTRFGLASATGEVTMGL